MLQSLPSSSQKSCTPTLSTAQTSRAALQTLTGVSSLSSPPAPAFTISPGAAAEIPHSLLRLLPDTLLAADSCNPDQGKPSSHLFLSLGLPVQVQLTFMCTSSSVPVTPALEHLCKTPPSAFGMLASAQLRCQSAADGS